MPPVALKMGRRAGRSAGVAEGQTVADDVVGKGEAIRHAAGAGRAALVGAGAIEDVAALIARRADNGRRRIAVRDRHVGNGHRPFCAVMSKTRLVALPLMVRSVGPGPLRVMLWEIGSSPWLSTMLETLKLIVLPALAT